MILVVLMTFAGFVIYSRSRGLDKLSIIIGLLFYFIGSLAMVAWSIALIGRQKLYNVCKVFFVSSNGKSLLTMCFSANCTKTC